MMNNLKYWWYRHVTRKVEGFVPWLARKLPIRLKYFVVVDGMVTVEPNDDPTHVTGMQLLDLWEERA